MRSSLQALTAELRRLKASGVKTLSVSESSLQQLRAVVRARAAQTPSATPHSAPAPKPRVEPRSDEASGAAPAVSTPPTPAPYEPPAPEFVVKTADPDAAPVPDPVPYQLPEGGKAVRWAALRDHVLNDEVCRTHVRSGKQVVFGVGNIDARVMFIGDAPGPEEENLGEPFVGPAGQLLTKMIGAMGLKRAEIYIANVVNWRPEMPVDAGGTQFGNRAPNQREMAYCLPYLKAQVDVVNPDILVALGATVAQALLGAGAFKTLGEVRGRWLEFDGKPLLVTYHPNYILRNQSNRSKRMIWEDLLKVMERAALPISEKQRSFFLEKT